MIRKVYAFNRNDEFSNELKQLVEDGHDVYVWGEHNLKGVGSIPLPKSTAFTTFSDMAQEKLHAFFKQPQFGEDTTDTRLDYVRKSIDLGFMDFVAFMETAKLWQEQTGGEIIAPRFFQDIYFCTTPSGRGTTFKGVVRALAKIGFLFIKSIVFSLATRSKINTPEILYLRKKVYPEFSMAKKIQDALAQKDVTLSASYIHFGRLSEKYGIKFLNAYKGMALLSLFAFIKTLYLIIKEISFFTKNKIPDEYMVHYFSDTFIAKVICSMNVKVMTGVLLDKPIFILLSRYKKATTHIASLNESFFYPPFRSFDYNHLNTYYCMNDVDVSVQNKFGGNIRRFKRVNFFRRDLIPNSKGISSDVTEAVSKFNHIAIIAPVQISKTSFGHWGEDDLVHFLNSCISVAELEKDTLFILKEKKGELRLMSPSFMKRCSDLDNVFIIRSESPKNNEYNQFEDIIKLSDLVISMSLTSTTIWQAIAHNKLAIAYNEIHPSSFLKHYPHMEVRGEDLHDAVMYWKNVNPKDKSAFIATISKDVGLGECNGLQQIADDLYETIQSQR